MKAKAIRPLSARQYATILDQLDTNSAALGRALGVNTGSARRWAMIGAVGPSALLLRLLQSGKITLEDCEEVPRDK